ncbi:MAG: chromosomal replication initiator protein DnaA [Alphaproteobacteria bacterium]|nr:chromosomal replication initiator protein DnaA [Alphaproteobacteria bacterium]
MSKKSNASAAKSEQTLPAASTGLERLRTEPTPEILAVWESVHESLRQEYGEAVFRSWLKPMQLQAFYQGTLEVSVPTRFMRDWIGSHYHDRIVSMCREANADIQRVQIVVQVQTLRDPAPATGAAALDVALGRASAEGDIYSELSSPLDPRFTFETFVVGKPNAFAVAACRRVVEADGMPFNPLYIYGGVGLGKTHLMHAMAHALRERQNRKVVYLSAEKFMYQFVRALRRQDSMNFKEQFRSVDVLMIDDIQFIAGKDSTQEEFFHTFNALVDQGKLIVISGDRAPMDLEGLDERLRSRLGWGLVADIKPSTFDLRLDVVKSKAALMNVELPQDVTHFLAGKITSNIRELEGALNRLAVHRDMTNAALTLDTTQEVLSDVLRSYERRITIDEIQRKVAEHYNLRLTDMHSARRSRNVARPRQVAMYLCKKLTTRSLPEIGRKFGGRDHTTVMHAVKKVEELMTEDTLFADEVNGVRRILKGD